jgi:hypothetical protein
VDGLDLAQMLPEPLTASRGAPAVTIARVRVRSFPEHAELSGINHQNPSSALNCIKKFSELLSPQCVLHFKK